MPLLPSHLSPQTFSNYAPSRLNDQYLSYSNCRQKLAPLIFSHLSLHIYDAFKTRKEEIKSKNTNPRSWLTGDCFSKGVIHLEEGQAAEMWDERGNRSLKTMWAPIFPSSFNIGKFGSTKSKILADYPEGLQFSISQRDSFGPWTAQKKLG